MLYDHNDALTKMRENEEVRKRFAAAYRRSPSGRYHEAQRAERAEAFEQRMESGGELKKLADTILHHSPTLPLECAWSEAGKRLGIL